MPEVSVEARIKYIRNSLQVTEGFQKDSDTLERKIDTLSLGLSNMLELLKSKGSMLAWKEKKLEGELHEICRRIKKIKNLHSADKRVIFVDLPL